MKLSQIGSTSQNVPGTYPREPQVCGRCPKCHPGRQYPESFCHALRAGVGCICHKENSDG